MASSDRERNAKNQPRVPVTYFPKGQRPIRVGEPSVVSEARTIPEFRADDFHTDPTVTTATPISEPTPTPPRRGTPRALARLPGAPKPDRRKGRRKTPLATRTPALKAAPGGELDRLLPKGPVSAEQLAQACLVGHQLFEQGRLEEARLVFEQLVGMDAPDPFPYTMLGTIYLALGDQSRALALFEAALTLDPNELAALVYRGEVRLNRGKLKSAAADLNRAVELGRPDDPFVDRAKRLLRMVHNLSKRAKKG